MDIVHCHLDGNADAVEFCPHESFHNVLAACTYTLQEGDQPSRTGSISLFDVDADSSRVSLMHRVLTAGIFDIKWSLSGGIVRPLLAQADADGYVRVHKLESCLDKSEVPGMFERLFSCLCYLSSKGKCYMRENRTNLFSCTIRENQVMEYWTKTDPSVKKWVFRIHTMN